MKRFSKLLAVVLAIAVIICPMTIFAETSTSSGTYKIELVDANTVQLTIGSTNGFIAYHATVGFNSDDAFQSNYTDAATGYKNGLKVISYTLKTAEENPNNKPAISASASGNSLTVIVMPTDMNNFDKYEEVVIGIRVADETTASLTKIQAADDGDGTIASDPTLLTFPAAGSDGVIDKNANDYNAADAVAAPHVHSFTNYVSNDDATCTEDGTKTATCDNGCGQTNTITDEGSARGHNMTKHNAVSSTCLVQGNIEYYTCSRCNKFFADESGAKELTQEETQAALAAHTPSNTTKFLKSAATCGDDAIYYQECSVCGEQLNTTWTDLGSHNVVDHTFGEYVSDGNATCAVDGTKTRTCSVCKATEKVTDTDSHLLVAHTVVNDAAVAATCTETGLTAGSHCSVCKTVLDAQEVVPALGHDFKTYTSNGNGKHTATCTRCDATDTQDCNTNGNDGACSVCGYKAAPAEPVYNADLASTAYQSRVNVSDKFGAVLSFRVDSYDCDDVDLVVSLRAIDTNTFNYSGIIKQETFNKDHLGSGGATYPAIKRFNFVFNNIALYEVGADLTYTLYLKKDGVRTQYYTFPTTSMAEIASDYYAQSSQQKTRDILADMLNLAEASRIYFGTRSGSANNNVLVQMSALNSGINSDDGSKDYGILSTPSGTTSSAVNVRLAISDTPALTFSFRDTEKYNECKDPSQMTVTFTYHSLGLNRDVTVTKTGEDFSADEIQYAANIGRYNFRFDNIALYDADKLVTATISNGTYEWVHQWSIEGVLANSIETTGAVGDVYRAMAYFKASAKAFWPTY